MSLTGTTATFIPYTLDGLQEITVDSSTVNTLQVNSLTPNRVVVADSANYLVSAGASTTEVDYLIGTTSNIQSQLNSKASQTYVDTNFLNKTTSTAQTVQASTTFLNGLTTADDRPAILGSRVVVGANYQSTLTSADVSVGQYFGTITNVGSTYQATSTGSSPPILILFPITVGKRYNLTIEVLGDDSTYDTTLDIYQSDNGVNPYPNYNDAVLDSPLFAPASTVFHQTNATFVATTTGSVVINLTTANPSGISTVQWKNMYVYEMGVALTNASLPAQLADRVAVINDKKQLVSSGISTTKLGYLDNVSSDIQTQLNARVPYTGATQALDMGVYKVTSTYVPTAGPDLINKTYGDANYVSSAVLTGYLPLTGGTLTGNLSSNTGTLVNFGEALKTVATDKGYTGASFTVSTAEVPAGVSTGTLSGTYRLTAVSGFGSMAMAIADLNATYKPNEYYTFTFTGMAGSVPLTLTVYQNSTPRVAVNITTSPQTITRTFTTGTGSGKIYFNFQALSANPYVDWTGFTMTRTDTQVNGVLDAKGNAIVSGYLGIGTTDPRDSLHVVKANAYASRSSNPLPSNIIASSSSQRLYMGSYYTGGAGACATIQSSDYYTDGGVPLDHGTNLLINPIGGFVSIGKTINGVYYDANCKLTVNADYAAGDTGGFCINATDNTTSNRYNLRLYPYVQASSQVAYQFKTYNVSTPYDAFKILHNGDVQFDKWVGIGKTPGQTLDVQGGIRAYGNGSGGPSPIYSENASGSSDAYAVIFLRNNNSGTGCYWFMNSTTRSADGGANTATLRNDAGNLRLQALGENGMTLNGSVITSNIRHTISAGDNSYTYYGPNATWNSAMVVGATPSRLNASTAQAITTNGNLHLDAAFGRQIYYGYYSQLSGFRQDHYMYGEVHAMDNWFRLDNNNTGLYWQNLGRGISSPEGGGRPYGNIATYGTGRNGWDGYDVSNRLVLMWNPGSAYGGIHDNNHSWLIRFTGTNARQVILAGGPVMCSLDWDLFVIWRSGAEFDWGNGYFYFNRGGGYGYSSDSRLKNNIQPIQADESITFLKHLQPSSFCMKEAKPYEKKNADGTTETVHPECCTCEQDGFIADNVWDAVVASGASKSVLNNWSGWLAEREKPEEERTLGKDTILGVCDRPILSHTVNVVKALMDRIEVLEAREKIWEERVARLEKVLEMNGML